MYEKPPILKAFREDALTIQSYSNTRGFTVLLEIHDQANNFETFGEWRLDNHN